MARHSIGPGGASVFLALAFVFVSFQGVRGQAGSAATGLDVDFTSATVPANGATLHYVLGGTGPVVVLLHGFPQDWSEYAGIMPRLAERVTVLAPDLRGVGESTAPSGGYQAEYFEYFFQLGDFTEEQKAGHVEPYAEPGLIEREASRNAEL